MKKLGWLFRIKENPCPTKMAYFHGGWSVLFQNDGVWKHCSTSNSGPITYQKLCFQVTLCELFCTIQKSHLHSSLSLVRFSIHPVRNGLHVTIAFGILFSSWCIIKISTCVYHTYILFFFFQREGCGLLGRFVERFRRIRSFYTKDHRIKWCNKLASDRASTDFFSKIHAHLHSD
jgi:hypothetical protein